jgi:hypothetical protein
MLVGTKNLARIERSRIRERNEMPSYVVRPEPDFQSRREASFETLSLARYFARTWAYKSRIPILVVDVRSGRAVERYSSVAETSRTIESSG